MTKIKDLVAKYGNREVDEVELEKILKPVRKTIYNLEVGDTYYVISTNGLIHECIWHNDDLNKRQLEIGNVFLTEEEAELEVERRKVKAELKRYASMCEEPIDWNNGDQEKHLLFYDYNNSGIAITMQWSCNWGDIHFTDKDILVKAIEEIGKDRIIKYYFGIKGETK